MRLIDADLLKKNCKCTGKFEDNFKGVDLIELAKVIDAQPTAFSIEKVVEQLEKEKEIHTEHYNISLYKDYLDVKRRYEQNCLVIDKTIEIVKRGGVDDD